MEIFQTGFWEQIFNSRGLTVPTSSSSNVASAATLLIGKTQLCLISTYNRLNKLITPVGIDSFVLCAILANFRRDLGIMLVKKNMITANTLIDLMR